MVPATSANLGPGYDSLGLALDLCDQLRLRTRDEPGVTVSVTGPGAAVLPGDERHLVVRSFSAGLAQRGLSCPGIDLHCDNSIPHGRGLGSSSAAIVGGIALANAVVVDGSRPLDEDEMVDLAHTIEGHPDNVAPAIAGGVTAAWLDESGRARVVRVDPHPGITAVVGVGVGELNTAHARTLLPAMVSHSEAAANSARAAILSIALTQRPDLLLTGTEDRLHQRYRQPAYPASYALVAALRDGGLAAAISGAGPSVLVLGTEPVDTIRDEVEAVAHSRGLADDFRFLSTSIRTAGVSVSRVA